MVIIRGKGFTLRYFRRGDEKFLVKHINKEIYRWTLRIPFPYTLKHAKDWVAKNLREYRKKKKTMLNFFIVKNDEVIGAVGFHDIQGHRAELGYWLAQPYWGQGIMTSAVRLLVKYGFQKLKLVRIAGEAYKGNKRSRRVLEKAGFRYEGMQRKKVFKDGKYIDIVMYARVR